MWATLIDFIVNDWRTLSTDLILGLVAIGVLVWTSWKLAVILFAVLSIAASVVLLALLATLLGITIRERINAWFE